MDRGGVERRYIIDYYYFPDVAPTQSTATGAAEAAAAEAPGAAQPVRFTSNIFVDVRPAVDDLPAALDRLLRFPSRAWAALQRPRRKAEGIDPATAPIEAAALSMLHSSATLGEDKAADASRATVATPQRSQGTLHAMIDARCKPQLDALKSATDDDTRRTAYMGLSYCTGLVACPNEAAAFMAATERASGDEEDAFTAMNKCAVEALVADRKQHAATVKPIQ